MEVSSQGLRPRGQGGLALCTAHLSTGSQGLPLRDHLFLLQQREGPGDVWTAAPSLSCGEEVWMQPSLIPTIMLGKHGGLSASGNYA